LFSTKSILKTLPKIHQSFLGVAEESPRNFQRNSEASSLKNYKYCKKNVNVREIHEFPLQKTPFLLQKPQ